MNFLFNVVKRHPDVLKRTWTDQNLVVTVYVLGPGYPQPRPDDTSIKSFEPRFIASHPLWGRTEEDGVFDAWNIQFVPNEVDTELHGLLIATGDTPIAYFDKGEGLPLVIDSARGLLIMWNDGKYKIFSTGA